MRPRYALSRSAARRVGLESLERRDLLAAAAFVSVEADPGKTQTLTFVADKPGSFRFRCNVTCGAMHPFMIGKLTVGTNEWLFRSIGLSIVAVSGVIILVKQKV